MQAQVEAIMNRARAVRSLILAEVEAAAPAELVFRPGDRWSVRDTLIHLATCEEMDNTVIGCLVKGEAPPKHEMLPPDEWNARELAKHADLDAAGAVEYVKRTRVEFERLAGLIAEEQVMPQIIRHLLMVPSHESGHLHQIREALAAARGDVVGAAVHALAYARHQVLEPLNLEERATASLEWRPEAGKWSVKENLLHLAIWDRFAVGVFAAFAEEREAPPMPYPDGELDRWNREQVEARSYMSLAEAIHELGAAHGALVEQIRRLTAAQWESDRVREWHSYREHDLHHSKAIWKVLFAWRKANG